MKYKLVIFDFDGTLADTLPWFVSSINQFADRYEFKRVEEGELEALRSLDSRKILKHLGLPSWKLPKIAKQMRALMALELDRISLFVGVKDLLVGLRNKGVGLAIVSSNSPENIQLVLGPEVSALIDYYECGASIFGKSSKLKKILRKSGFRPDEVIFIGDEVRDIEAAKDVDMASGAVSWGYNIVDSLKEHSPQEVFFRIDEIVDKLDGNATNVG